MIRAYPGDAAYLPLVSFLAQRIGGSERGFSPGTVFGLTKGDAVSAVVLFHNYDPGAGVIEISAASDDKRWLTRPVLRALFGYAFNELGCQAVVARIDPERAALARIFTAYGFQRFDLPRLRGRNKGEAVLILADDDWRLNGFHKDYGHGKTGTGSN